MLVTGTANSVEDWVRLSKQARTSAFALARHQSTYNQAWAYAGFSVEALLKASIMAKERFNAWPSRGARPDLYVHDLEKLALVLGMEIVAHDVVAPAWSVMLQWRREHMYVTGNQSAAVIKGLLDAAFAEKKGVCEWISRNYLPAS